MNNEKIGNFIAAQRKENHLTQRELAERLNITDKAVSKWERGLSCPDISLLAPLAGLLGVTTGELLNGEREALEAANAEENIGNALRYADAASRLRVKSIQRAAAAALSCFMLAGIVVCAICDLAVSGAFTWSLYPISSIVFAWLVLFPAAAFGKKGIWASLLVLTAAIVPYLAVLDALVSSGGLVLAIGVRMAAFSVVFLLGIFLLFRLLRKRKWIAAALSALLALPFCLLINLSLAALIAEPPFDIWDLMTFSILAAAAGAFFFLDAHRRQPS